MVMTTTPTLMAMTTRTACNHMKNTPMTTVMVMVSKTMLMVATAMVAAATPTMMNQTL